MIVPFIPAYTPVLTGEEVFKMDMSDLGVEVVFEQAEETQISELGVEIVLEEV